MAAIVANDGQTKPVPEAGEAPAGARDCSACPRRFSCPLSPLAAADGEGGRT